MYVKAHLGTVVAGPLGAAGDKRPDLIGRAVNDLFLLPAGEFVLSAALQARLA